ncbi:MAG: hypothetical protein ACRD38_10570, partial [Nitrososphaerales archaeon]
LYYRVFDGTSWGAVNTVTAGILPNTVKQISSDSDSANTAYMAYLANGNQGALKVARFASSGTFEVIETADSTLNHWLPAITITQGDVIEIYSLANNKVYLTKKIYDAWEVPSNPYKDPEYAPDELTAATRLSASLWSEGAAPDKSIIYDGATINLLEVRNKYGSTYEIPGEPSSNNSVDIKYKLSKRATIKIEIVDYDGNTLIRSTGDLTKNKGTYSWSPSWTWENKPDSYKVTAYYRSGSNWRTGDIVLGFVQADKLIRTVEGWSPNMYTRAEKSSLGTDYSIFKFRYLYWDNSVYNPDQGTPRLDLLKSRAQETTGFKGKFVTEFRRAENGYDAVGSSCVPLAWNSNLPNPQREVKEIGCPGDQDEEFEIFTQDEELMTVVTGSDPTNISSKNGYFSEVTFKKRSPGTTVNLTMEFELEEYIGDFPFGDWFDVIEATKQTEVV